MLNYSDEIGQYLPRHEGLENVTIAQLARTSEMRMTLIDVLEEVYKKPVETLIDEMKEQQAVKAAEARPALSLN